MKKTLATLAAAAAVASGTIAVAVVTLTSTGPRTWQVTTATALANAEQNAQPGDTVEIDGTFHNVSLVPKVSGTQTAPITYRSTSGATFDGAGPSGVAAIAGRSWLVFANLTFANSAYATAPVTNHGVVVRSSSHVSFAGDHFSHMQLQLIGSSWTSVTDSDFNTFVAAYSNGQPTTSGDMVNLVLGSHDNYIARDTFRYAGHSLLEIGNGSGNTEQNARNVIEDNSFSNPWYKDVIASDDGAGTVIRSNAIADANSVPTLVSTVLGQQGSKQMSSAAVQFSGENFTLTGNTITNAVCTYGCIDIGSRYYPGPPAASTIESLGNTITWNTLSNCKGAAAVGFVVFQTSTDPSPTPRLTGNTISDNTFTGNSSSPFAAFPTFTAFLYHAASYATPWRTSTGAIGGANGNTISRNTLGTSAAYLVDVTYGGKTTHAGQSLATFQLDPTVFGNS